MTRGRDMQERVEELTARLDELSRELAALRAGLSPGRPVPARLPGPGPALMSRRTAFAAAVGGMSALTAGITLAPPAAAAPGGNLILGQPNFAGSAVTSVTASPGSRSATFAALNSSSTTDSIALYAQFGPASGLLAGGGAVIGDAASYPGAQGLSTYDYGVVGTSVNSGGVYGQGKGTGVAGCTPDGVGVRGSTASKTQAGVSGDSAGGPGVSGVSKTGVGVTAKGGRAPLRLVPATKKGAPKTGKHSVGELWCDSAGALYVCRKAGSPGTWKQLTVS